MERGQQNGRFRVGDWMVDPAIDEIATGGRTQKLEPRTMRLLVKLAQAGGEVVSSERLLDEVWSGVVVGPASVYQAVSQLRKLLGDDDAAPQYIATVPRKGYRLLAPVEWLGLAAQPPRVAAPTEADQDDTGSHARPDADPPSRDRADPRARRIVRAVALVALIAASGALAWWFWPRAVSPTVAVLPFLDLSPEGGQQIFCDGLTEEVSNWLAQVPQVRVVARTSAFAFRGRDGDVRKIGKDLSASHVLEGSVRRSADRVRVTAQLIDARTGYQLWSQAIDRPFADVITIQDDIARAVTMALELRLSPGERQGLDARNPANARAYERYLLAREAYRRRSVRDNAQALSLYDEAIALDPRFALAYAGRATARLNDMYLSGAPRAAAVADAEESAAKALALAPNLPEALTARAAVRNEQRRYDAAISDLDRAVAANPNSVDALAERARVYRTVGRSPDALPSVERAAELDPLDPTRYADLCGVLRDTGRYEAAGTACARARSLEPNGPWGLLETAYLEFAQGRLDEAWRWLELGSADRPHDALLAELRANILCMLGLPAKALELLERVRGTSDDRERTDLDIASARYLEQGATSLREFLARSTLNASGRAEILLSAAQLYLLAEDLPGASALVDRALVAADFDRSMLDGPDYLRWATAGAPVVAWIEMQRGETARATEVRAALAAALARMNANGEAGFGIRVVTAELDALEDRPDAAVAALDDAIDRGWRGIAWANSAPHLAPLRARADYRALATRVARMNDLMRARVQAESLAR